MGKLPCAYSVTYTQILHSERGMEVAVKVKNIPLFPLLYVDKDFKFMMHILNLVLDNSFNSN